jgi:hypothetical protein
MCGIFICILEKIVDNDFFKKIAPSVGHKLLCLADFVEKNT